MISNAPSGSHLRQMSLYAGSQVRQDIYPLTEQCSSKRCPYTSNTTPFDTHRDRPDINPAAPQQGPPPGPMMAPPPMGPPPPGAYGGPQGPPPGQGAFSYK